MQQKNRFRLKNTVFTIILIAGLISPGFNQVFGQVNPGNLSGTSGDSIINLKFPFQDNKGIPFGKSMSGSPLYLKMPANIQYRVSYDPDNNEYTFNHKIGELDYRSSYSMGFDDYRKADFNKSIKDYWFTRVRGESFEAQSSLIPKLYVGGEAFDRIFGSNTINIRPQGSAELIFGLQINNTENPSLPEKVRKNTTFDFDNRIQMNVTGQIGDKLELGISYNTEATFDFENKTRIAYTGKDDEILKKIEAGNVNLPLTGSLISGSQSLFGIKTELQFGRLTVTSVFSQQEGESKTIEVEGGGVTNDFEIHADEYEANRHFFLTQYFRDIYDQALRSLPVVNSGINITKVEVWVTNKSNQFEQSRNVVAFLDLAEGINRQDTNIFNTNFVKYRGSGLYPSNSLNDLYENLINNYSGIRDVGQVTSVLTPLSSYGFEGGQDYEKIENARRLQPTEYQLNEKLGYLSLNQALNSDEILAVAFEYTLGGSVYRVGEFSNEVNKDAISDSPSLILKLLKGTNLAPGVPTWDLMMKNIYSMGASRVNTEEFFLEVLYQNDKTGTAINYLPGGAIDGEILIKVLNLDNLNSQLDQQPDGVFDFIDRITIDATKGRIIFPVLEPFGSYLREKIEGTKPGEFAQVADEYVFEELYNETQSRARQIAEKNKFLLSGRYRSESSSEIRLNAMNISPGSVMVTAGGMQLTENQDYTVDYTMGTVKIINQALVESGTPIKISLENNALFSIQSKTMVGTHLDYRFSKDFNMGGTILHLKERPLTTKVNIGEEPISNTIWGLNTNYRKNDVQWLTKAVDFLPFIETKERSSITFTGEFAQLVPGHSKVIDEEGSEQEGQSLIDDFEGSETSYDIRPWQQWVMASTPQGQSEMFPEAQLSNDLAYGFNRAKLAWYQIDPLFLRNNSATPSHLANNDEEQFSHFVREIKEQEIFPFKQSPNNIPTFISVLNMAYYPGTRGPYNYDALPAGSLSAGMNSDGTLRQPESRWGGVMRKLVTNDFEAANVEFIEFWLMDPFVEDSIENIVRDDMDPALYFNFGNISEDILKDGRKSFENGLPIDENVILVDSTAWGRVPITQSFVNAFDNVVESRVYQDVGLDGLGDDEERSFFQSYLDTLQLILNPASEAYTSILSDPSGDNYKYYRGTQHDEQQLGILERYKYFNGLENNSPTPEQSTENYPTQSTNLPNIEDINTDNTLSEAESYFQYKISLKKEDMRVGRNYIADAIVGRNKDGDQVTWYQFKVPIYEPEKIIGSIQDFKSIRFMRLFLRGIADDMILRFASLDLVRGEWRKYNLSLMEGTEHLSPPEYTRAKFEVSAVNIEENGNRYPVNYVLPVGLRRTTDPTNPHMTQQNEQSIAFKLTGLEDGDARAAYKNVRMDMRQYRKLKMHVHAEAFNEQELANGDLRAFIRIGSDYTQNYYEYEIPLVLTPHLHAPSKYDQNSLIDRDIVWPEVNAFAIVLNVLQQAKQERNDMMRMANSPISLTTSYAYNDGSNRVIVKGNPNLSNVRTIMIGVRNPSQMQNDAFDDGLAKSGMVWMNEMRLTDFNEDGGWAANARFSAQLADFGRLTMSGGTSNPGFGSIDRKVQERSKEELLQYDVSSTLQLGKFFPQKAGVNIPVYMGYSETRRNPQYNPLDPDIPLQAALENVESKAERDSILYISQNYQRRKSINLTNVKVEGQNRRRPKIYSLSNFSVTYSFNEVFSRDINTEFNLNKNYSGVFSYIYNGSPKPWEPFKKVEAFNKPAFRALKDFNLYYQPSMLRFQTNMDRRYAETQLRNVANPDLKIEPTFNKNFNWNRLYDFKWDVTRNLKLDFTSNNIARIDEPNGPMHRDDDDYEAKRDSIWQNVTSFGRNTQYHHSINSQYSLPINKIPLLDWISSTASYRVDYDWAAGPITADTIRLGNTIQNNRQFQMNGQFNLRSLYGKVGVLKKIENKYSRRGRATTKKEVETVSFENDKFNIKGKQKKNVVHDLVTEDITVTLFDKNDNPIDVDVEVVNNRRVIITTQEDLQNGKLVIEGDIVQRENPLIYIAENAARILMATKSARLSFSNANGAFLPGFLPEPQWMGMRSSNSALAPGWDFILGLQDEGFGDQAAAMGWITSDSTLNEAYWNTNNQGVQFSANLEPLPNLRLDINATWSMNSRVEQFYIHQGDGQFSAENQMISGNFSMSFLSIGSAFEAPTEDGDYSSESWESFKNNRFIISDRLGKERLANMGSGSQAYDPNNGETPGYTDGYGPTSQDVLIPAFIAAYAGKDPETISLNAMPSVFNMLPNWTISYNGLDKIPFFKKYVKSMQLRHSYRSTYSVGSFATNLFYNPEEIDGLNYIRDLQMNFLPDKEIGGVSINEQFSPFLSLDMQLTNTLTTRLEYKKTRSMTLSFNNNQLMENKSESYVIGLSYRFQEVPITIKTGGNKRSFQSDLNLRADIEIRDNRMIMRKLEEDIDKLTSGQRAVTLKFTADYVLSSRFNLRLFYDQNINRPFIQLSYPTSNTKFGFNLRFTLAN
ncbi:MAG: cell surface protein SprA [Bacteroidetes bacterium]|nr:cell surface protein SprA [Bacteroidota bacterium]